MPEAIDDDELFGKVPAAAEKTAHAADPTAGTSEQRIPLQALDPYAAALPSMIIDAERAKDGPAVAVALPDGTELLFHDGVLGPVTAEQYPERVTVEPSAEDGARIQLLRDATAELAPEASTGERVQAVHAALEAQGVDLL